MLDEVGKQFLSRNLPEPMICNRNGCHSHSQSNRGNLCAIKKAWTQKADGEEEVEEEYKECTSYRSPAIAVAKAGCNCHTHHTCRNSKSTKKKKLPPTKTVNGKEGDEGSEALPRKSARR
jgi:hypothetical protein